jgi:hypothetical protein
MESGLKRFSVFVSWVMLFGKCGLFYVYYRLFQVKETEETGVVAPLAGPAV